MWIDSRPPLEMICDVHTVSTVIGWNVWLWSTVDLNLPLPFYCTVCHLYTDGHFSLSKRISLNKNISWAIPNRFLSITWWKRIYFSTAKLPSFLLVLLHFPSNWCFRWILRFEIPTSMKLSLTRRVYILCLIRYGFKWGILSYEKSRIAAWRRTS